jgi:hypothetical protein
MAKLIRLIKESFELFVKMRWLKTISKEIDKCNKIKEQLDRQRYVVSSLIEEYMEIYGEDLRQKEKDNG